MLSPENKKVDLQKEKIVVELGQLKITQNAKDELEKAEVSPKWFIAKHQEGDWGDISEHDKARNDSALRQGFWILSAHTLPKTGEKILIVTESDRTKTTILLPEEF